MNMSPFSNSGENYWSQDKDYRQDFWYNSRGLRGQGQLRQGHSPPEDLWDSPTQAILVGVVKDTAQEKPIIPEPG